MTQGIELSEDDHDLLTQRSDEDLQKEIAQVLMEEELGKDALGAKPPSIKALLRKFDSWLNEELDKLREIICPNEKIQKHLTESPSSRFQLVKLLMDILSAAYTSMPLASLAELLARNGIHELCDTSDTPKGV